MGKFMLSPKCVQNVYHIAAYNAPSSDYIRNELSQVLS